MNTDTILASLREEVTRHTGLAALSQEEVMRRTARHKASTMQAAHNIFENTWRYNMFYLKKNGQRHTITNDNVFTTCPDCGKEFKVDLIQDLSKDNDLYTTRICCPACSEREANG